MVGRAEKARMVRNHMRIGLAMKVKEIGYNYA